MITVQNLINLLHIFRNKVVENGSKFYILVYPNLNTLIILIELLMKKKMILIFIS